MLTSSLHRKHKRRFATLMKTAALRRRCPKVRYRACWCRGICEPRDGKGQCGLPAAHAMQGRTQRAIAEQMQARQDEAGTSA